MAQVNEFLKNPTVRNTAIGIGVAILVPVVARAVAPYIRPVTRSVLKMGVVAYEKGREAVAEFGEIVDDMVAEVRDEMRAERELADEALDDLVANAEEMTEAASEGTNSTRSA